MIALDTNVLSALMQRTPDARVVAWADRQPAESLWTTAVTVFEIRFGIDLLPAGRRRNRLGLAFQGALDLDFQGRVLPFDREAAEAAGAFAAVARRRGRVVDFRDVEIAGIVAVQKAALATRNVRHFEGFGLTIIDPWAT